MEPSELLRITAEKLDELGIEYLVTGSMATIAYGEPRFTNDIDIAIRADGSTAAKLAEAFTEPEFYADAQAAMRAARDHEQFNVIHPSSGLKIDFMVVADDEFDRSRFARARMLAVLDRADVRYAAPEDVILRKLQYHRDGGSDKHLRDIRGILTLLGDGVDSAYIDSWVDRLGVQREWDGLNRAE